MYIISKQGEQPHSNEMYMSLLQNQFLDLEFSKSIFLNFYGCTNQLFQKEGFNNDSCVFFPFQTDVIVNSGYMQDFKSGRVAQSILRQAGVEMEKELDKVNLSTDYQEVWVTKGFKLSCQYVFHVAWHSQINKYQVS